MPMITPAENPVTCVTDAKMCFASVKITGVLVRALFSGQSTYLFCQEIEGFQNRGFAFGNVLENSGQWCMVFSCKPHAAPDTKHNEAGTIARRMSYFRRGGTVGFWALIAPTKNRKKNSAFILVISYNNNKTAGTFATGARTVSVTGGTTTTTTGTVCHAVTARAAVA